MNKRLLICAVALLFAATFSVAADKAAKEGSWTGWITDTHCGAKGDSEKHASCAAKCVKDQGAKYALYNPADKKVYALDAQDKAAGHAGHNVKVTGTADGDTIKVKSIEMVPAEKAAPAKKG